jgi:phosphatidylglycerophosphatase A
MNRLAVFLATAGGAGYAPVAPGTAGSAVGLLLYVLIWKWTLTGQLALLVVVSIVGVWASDRAARHFAREDPGPVVIDEVAGQLLTLIAAGGSPVTLVLGFLLFRGLDIVKPWPAGRFEDLPGGLGIMADDLMAGFYGRLILMAVASLAPAWF